jgi:hypothetical protein
LDQDAQSMLTALWRAQLAVGMTLARGVASYAELTLKHGADATGAFVEVLQTPDQAGRSAWDQAGARVLTGYRDYLREVSALARLMSMAVFDNMETLRPAEPLKQQDGLTQPGPPTDGPPSPPSSEPIHGSRKRAPRPPSA